MLASVVTLVASLFMTFKATRDTIG
jgi:hypothetical protein